jgi:hypothetical protein
MTNNLLPSYQQNIGIPIGCINQNLGIPMGYINQNQANIINIFHKYDIMETMINKLEILKITEVVIIADDSSSMDARTELGTRWTELQKFISIALDVVSSQNPNGIDIYFLNKKYPFQKVTNIEQLREVFNKKPNGVTPLTKTLNEVIADKAELDKKVLVLIITDGEPTDELGKISPKITNEFKECLKRKPKNFFVNILACTTNDNTMDYLNKWDNEINNFDVTDDYESEKKEIMKAKNGNFEFTYGTYVMKAVVGSLDPSLDDLDEEEYTSTKKNEKECGCIIQ